MSQLLRKILFFSFIAAFVIITPLVMLYAAGYKLNTETGRIQKTGALNVKTDPSGARIFLNDKPVNDTSFIRFVGQQQAVRTPAKIKNLLPGEYKLRVEADGFWPWEKKINIYPGQAINIDQLILVRKDLPLLAATTQADKVIISTDKSRLITASKDKCQIFSLVNENLTDALAVCSAGNFKISEDGKKILSGNKVYVILENNSLDEDPISALIPAGALLIRFDQLNSDNLYYYDKKDVYELQENSSAIKVASLANLRDYIINGNFLYYLNNGPEKNILTIYDIGQNKIVRKIELPGAPDHRLEEVKNNYVIVSGQGEKVRYVIDPDSFTPLLATLYGLRSLSWIGDATLLYSNDFEIWKMDLNSRRQELITRQSQVIKNTIWYPTGEFLIFSTNNSLNLLDLSGSERTITELIKMDEVASPVLDKSNESIYFYGAIREMKGIYKLRIR